MSKPRKEETIAEKSPGPCRSRTVQAALLDKPPIGHARSVYTKGSVPPEAKVICHIGRAGSGFDSEPFPIGARETQQTVRERATAELNHLFLYS
jgi:hypothetical protein